MIAPPAGLSTFAGATAAAPSRVVQIANFVFFQAAWFAVVLGAAHERPIWGTACVGAAVAWHLSVSARPRREAVLVGLACLVGLVFETVVVGLGVVAYPSGQPIDGLAPYWMVALWGELAIALNVTMRWLKPRLWLASAFGALGGPMAFSAGVALGGAQFVDKPAALATLTVGYALLLPLMVWLARRFDGVSVPEDAHG